MRRIIPFVPLVPSIIVIAILLVFGGGFGMYAWKWEHRPHVLEIYCFALDKSGASPGNLAVFIRTPDGHTILIDGGKSNAVVVAVTSVTPFYRRSIDTIISTNPNDSNVTGLIGVIRRYHVGRVIEMASTSVGTVVGLAHGVFEKEVESQKIPRAEVRAGDRIDLGDPALSATVWFPTVGLESLAPLPSSVSTSSTSASSTSSALVPTISSASSTPDFVFSKTNPPVLAFSIRFGSTTILFGGDITKKEQTYVGQEIASSSPSSVLSLSTRVLLVLPHGKNVGVPDESFFTVVNPETVVVLKKVVSGTKKSTPVATTKLVQVLGIETTVSTTTVAVGVSTSVSMSMSLATSVSVSTPSTEKIQKTKPKKVSKPPKPPFDISSITGLSVVNLAADGDTEFISDGSTFFEKKIGE